MEEERKEYLENRRKLLDAGLREGSTLRLIVHKVEFFFLLLLKTAKKWYFD